MLIMSGTGAPDIARLPADRRDERRRHFVARPVAPLPYLVRYSTHIQIALPFLALFIVMAGLVWPLLDSEVVRLRVDPRAGSMVSDRPIRGDGPDGEVDAEGLEVRGQGERVIFTGRVRLLLQQPAEEER